MKIETRRRELRTPPYDWAEEGRRLDRLVTRVVIGALVTVLLVLLALAALPL